MIDLLDHQQIVEAHGRGALYGDELRKLIAEVMAYREQPMDERIRGDVELEAERYFNDPEARNGS